MIPRHHSLKTYQARRKKLSRVFSAETDLVLYFNTSEKMRNYDREYSYRASSSFLYLTGFPEPQSAFMMWQTKGSKSSSKLNFHMFTLSRDPAMEQWTGLRYGPAGAIKTFGADQAFVISELKTQFHAWMDSRPAGAKVRILTNALKDPSLRSQLYDLLDSHKPKLRKGPARVVAVEDIDVTIQEDRLVKDAEEIKTMREAARITSEAHLKALHAIKAGLFEYEVQAVIESEFLRQGAREPAYTSIVAAGANATILHYISNNAKLKSGDLLLIDAGCEYQNYAGDITRTFPVSGKYTKAQREIMEIVGAAHKAAIRVSRVGLPFSKIHQTAEKVLVEGLRSLKILKGSTQSILEKGTHKRYFPHGTGHWLGLDVHDECPYVDDKGASLKLKAGMVFTVEPGLYFLPNDKTVPAEYRGIGVRIEDDVLVRSKGAAEIITVGCPRYADEIEKAMSAL
jgi:Xaa-Pro aminopeptidase